jgi:hypothetical protein
VTISWNDRLPPAPPVVGGARWTGAVPPTPPPADRALTRPRRSDRAWLVTVALVVALALATAAYLLLAAAS